MVAPARPSRLDAAVSFLGSAEFARAITICVIGTAFLSHALRALVGWAGLISIIVALTLLASASLFVRRGMLEWRGLLTVSLLAFVGWCCLSLLWSDYQWATLAGVLYQVALAVLGVYIALVRDPIQIVRSFGDVLRALLVASLVLEVLSGLLIDTPITFLGITGSLDSGGPIQGLFGSRNQLGLVTLIAIITFVAELLTRSVPRNLSIGSLTLGALILLFTSSPVTLGTLVVVAAAGLVLAGLRRLDPDRRRIGQFVVTGAVVLTLLASWLARTQIIDALNAGSEFEYRYTIWKRILQLVSFNPLEGFGWLGFWRTELPPYILIDAQDGAHPSAFNAYLDTLLQVGVVGLVLVLLGLAVVRSWLLASNRKSVVYVWPALVIIALMITSAAESSMLVEYGWLILVIVAVRGSEGLSWRRGLRDSADTSP